VSDFVQYHLLNIQYAVCVAAAVGVVVAAAGDGNASLASGATTPTYGRSMTGGMPAFSPNSSPSKRSLSRQNSQGNLGGHKRVGGVSSGVWDTDSSSSEQPGAAAVLYGQG
jgi:hypothetical protein